jgi:hypothetical protein
VPLQQESAAAETAASEQSQQIGDDVIEETDLDETEKAKETSPHVLEESITLERPHHIDEELNSSLYDPINAPPLEEPSPNAPMELYPTLPGLDLCIQPEPTAPEAPAEPFLDEELLKEITPMDDAQLSTLYYNDEVAALPEIVSEFMEGQKALLNHPLAELLSTYMKARTKLIAACLEMQQLIDEAKSKQEASWCPGEGFYRETGKCLDNVTVSVQHSYPTAELNEETLSALGRNLSNVRSVLNENISLYAYKAEVLRLQVNTWQNCPVVQMNVFYLRLSSYFKKRCFILPIFR